MNKKYSALFLVFLFIAATLFACAEDTSGDSVDGSLQSTNLQNTDQQNTEPETADPIVYEAGIPSELNYNGDEVGILVYDDSSYVWYDVDFSAEEITGEQVNDAVYSRMKNTEELIGINFKVYPLAPNGGSQNLKRSILAQDSQFDFAYINSRAAIGLAQEQLLIDLLSMDTLNLNEPWWNQNAISDLTLANRLYMAVGDIGIMYIKTVSAITYNKSFISDFNLENPSQLVAENKWTIDALGRMAKVAAADLNGDNERTHPDDRFGAFLSGDMLAMSLIGGGVDFAKKGTDDLPQITLNSPHMIDVFNKLTDLFFDTDVFYGVGILGSADRSALFSGNKALFNFIEFHQMELLRSMNDDFGILPMPLYDENQDQYRHTILPNVAAVVVVPLDTPNIERTGYVLSALGAESKNLLTPAYYDIYLKVKVSRDEESESVLDLIFSTIRYDFGYVYNWGNMTGMIGNLMTSESKNITSSYDAIEALINAEIGKTLDAFMK